MYQKLNSKQVKKSLLKYTRLVVLCTLVFQFIVFIPTFRAKGVEAAPPAEITIGPDHINYVMGGKGTLDANGNATNSVTFTLNVPGEPLWEHAYLFWGTAAADQSFKDKQNVQFGIGLENKQVSGTRYYDPGAGDEPYQSSDSYISNQGELSDITASQGQITITVSDLDPDPNSDHEGIGAGIILPYRDENVYQTIKIHPFGFDIYDDGDPNNEIDQEGFNMTLTDIDLSSGTTAIKAGFFFGETEFPYRKCRPAYLGYNGQPLNPKPNDQGGFRCEGANEPPDPAGHIKIPRGDDMGWFDTRITGEDLEAISTSNENISFYGLSKSWKGDACPYGKKDDRCNGESFTFMVAAVAYPVSKPPQQVPSCTNLSSSNQTLIIGEDFTSQLTTTYDPGDADPADITFEYGKKIGDIHGQYKPETRKTWDVSAEESANLDPDQTIDDAAWVYVVYQGVKYGGPGTSCAVNLFIDEEPPPEPKRDLLVDKVEVSSGIYEIGNIVKFKVLIKNIGEEEFDVVYFKDEYDKSYLKFNNKATLKYYSPSGTLKDEIDIAMDLITTNTYSTKGILMHPDLTELVGANLAPGEYYEIYIDFVATKATSTACNRAIADADAIQKFDEVCVPIEQPPELPKTDM